VMLGVLAGSIVGAKVLITEPSQRLRIVFRVVLGALAVELIVSGLRGRL
jgi:uncharacterized membrane protein YfcA